MGETPNPSQAEIVQKPQQLSWREKLRQYFNPDDNQPADPKRRELMVNAGKAAMVLPLINNELASSLADMVEGKEKEKNSSNTEFLDLSYDDDAAILHTLLGKDDKSDQLDIKSKSYKEHESTFIMDTDPAVVKTAVLNKYLKDKSGHSLAAVDTFLQIEKNNGIFKPETPQVKPLESAMTATFSSDELQNSITKIEINPDKIAAMLAKSAAETPIVNIGTSVGERQDIYKFRSYIDLPHREFIDDNNIDAILFAMQDEYAPQIFDKDGKLVDALGPEGKLVPIVTLEEFNKLNEAYHQKSAAEFQRTGKSEGVLVHTLNTDETTPTYIREITGAYSEKLALQNLKKLIELANKFPDKTFICAGGDEDDKENSFYYVRKDLEAEQGGWPDNLIMVGLKHGKKGGVEVESDGCDIYLESSDFDSLNDGFLTIGEATAVVSAVASLLDNKLRETVPDAAERAKIVRMALQKTAVDEGRYLTKGIVGKDDDEVVSRKCKVLKSALYKDVLKKVPKPLEAIR